jgi:hypothetical protein
MVYLASWSLDQPEKLALESAVGAPDERTVSYMPETRPDLSEGIQ